MKNSIVALMLALCVPSFATDKKDLTAVYKDKYLVVLRDGLAVGQCSDSAENPGLVVKIDGDRADFHGFAASYACGNVVPDPVRKGEVLRVIKPYFNSRWASIEVELVTPHQVTRGVGAFQHGSLERGTAKLRFKPSGDYDSVRANIDQWVKVYDDQDAALVATGNTASGVQVRQVKEGMSPSEVEAVLGVPETRADIGEKVLYKYKDMTVEFKGGKVTDVR